MLQHIEITNFLRIAYLNLEIRQPVLFIAGHNEVGKSSIAEAVRFVVRGENPRVQYKRDLQQLIKRGAKKGSAQITFENFTVRRNVRDGKATGDTERLPADDVITGVCLGGETFTAMKIADRRNLLMRLMEVELTPDRVAKELKQRGFPKAVIEKYRPLFETGMGAAHDKAKRAANEDRGAWAEVTGERYGSEKAQGWEPERSPIDENGLNQAIADIDQEIAALGAKRDEELAPVLTRIQTLRNAETKGDTRESLACPECGAAVVLEDGKLVAYVPGDKPKSNTALISIQNQRADAIREKYAGQLNQLAEGKRTMQKQLDDDAAAVKKTARAAELHEAIKIAEALEGLFGEDDESILGRFVAEALEGFNQRLAHLAGVIGWKPVTVAADMEVTRQDQVPYHLLSESAKWRADAMLHTIIAELAKFPWLIFDRMDVLDVPGRVRFLKWANEYGSQNQSMTILVMATLQDRPKLDKFSSIQWHWMEGGEIAE